MRLRDDGIYETDPSETITITTVLRNASAGVDNLVTFPPQASPCNCAVTTTRPNDITATGTFTMPVTSGSRCSIDVVYDFVPDNAGQFGTVQYDVTLTGAATIQDQPFRPPPNSRGYDFQVR